MPFIREAFLCNTVLPHHTSDEFITCKRQDNGSTPETSDIIALLHALIALPHLKK